MHTCFIRLTIQIFSIISLCGPLCLLTRRCLSDGNSVDLCVTRRSITYTEFHGGVTEVHRAQINRSIRKIEFCKSCANLFGCHLMIGKVVLEILLIGSNIEMTMTAEIEKYRF